MWYKVYQIVILPLLAGYSVVLMSALWLCCVLGGERIATGTLARIWAKGICLMLLLRVEVRGRDNLKDGEHYVFMANHQGALDICMLNGYLGRDFKWMMKKQLESVPFLGASCKKARFVMVDNANAGAVRRTCRETAALMRDGYSICLFPEGMRTPDGYMHPFRKGGFVLAQGMDFRIVPVTINGSYDAFPRHSEWKLVRHEKLSLTIHQPVSPDGTREALMTKVYDAIHEDLCNQYK